MRYIGVHKDGIKYIAKLGIKVIGEYKTAEEAADAYNEKALKVMTFPILNHTPKYKKSQEVEAPTPAVEKTAIKKEEPVKEVPNEPSEQDTISKLLKELNDLSNPDQGLNVLNGLSDLSASSK